jgi:hypothetical protein
MNELLTPLLDADGKVKRWPKKAAERTAVLEYFAGKFEKGKDYTEMEVNAVIGSSHTFSDNSGLRRELITAKMLNRTPDGKRYWKE